MLLRQRQEGSRWTALDEAMVRITDPAADFARAEDAAYLRQAIASLPVRYRAPLVLCELEGRSYEEAAQELGCAVGTVRSRLHRARALLARKLQWKREGQRCTV
jgi:RNA polymerase sigma-70 factor, ECF subfamily